VVVLWEYRDEAGRGRARRRSALGMCCI